MVPEEDRLRILGGEILYRESDSSLGSRRLRAGISLVVMVFLSAAMCILTVGLGLSTLHGSYPFGWVGLVIGAVASVFAVATIPLFYAKRQGISPLLILKSGFVPPDAWIDSKGAGQRKEQPFLAFDAVLGLEGTTHWRSGEQIMIVHYAGRKSFGFYLSSLRRAGLENPKAVRHLLKCLAHAGGMEYEPFILQSKSAGSR